MPFTLRRSRRKDLTPSRSLVDVVKSKVFPVGDSHRRELASACKYDQSMYGPLLTDDFASPDRRHEEYYKSHWIARLPAELLAHVFVMGSEDDTILPITVSHVCRQWRYLALRTPAVWRRISLDSRLRMWSERIARARACSLDIEIMPQALPITPRLRRHYLDAQTVQLYMHMIHPYISRWRSLTVEFQHYAPYLWNAALSVCCGFGPGVQAPRLEALSLVHPNNDDTKEFLLFHGHAPLLRSATLDGIRLTWLPSLFANLTYLDYTHHGFTRGQDVEVEVFNILRVCSQLKELRLAFPGQSRKTVHLYENELPAQAQLYLQYLHTLTIHIESPEIPSALINLLPRLHLRALRTLTLSSPSPRPHASHGRHQHDVQPPILTTFTRLRKFLKSLGRLPNVTRLEIMHAWCRASFVCGILSQHVPRLRQLSLHSSTVDDAFLWSVGEACRERYRVMYPPPGGMPYVVYQPLKVLEVTGGTPSGEGFLSVVRRMLASGVTWVGEIWIKDCRAIDSDVVKRAARFGVPVRLLPSDMDLKNKGLSFGAASTGALTWTRQRCRH